MKKTLTLLFIVFLSVTTFAEDFEIYSPSKNIKLVVSIDKTITYSIYLNDIEIISPSKISLTLDNNEVLGENPNLKSVSEATDDGSIPIIPVVKVKNAQIIAPNNSMKFRFAKSFQVHFKVFNDGVAYQFITSKDKDITVFDEHVEFNFPKDYSIYFPEEKSIYTHQERLYKKLKLSEINDKRFCSTPALVELDNGAKILLAEANLYSYAGMFLKGSKGNKLIGKFSNYPIETIQTSDRDVKVKKYANYIAKTKGNRTFPWRVMIITEKDADLINSQLIFVLSDKLKLKNTDWIKPGKVAWDWWNALNVQGVDFETGVNTATYKYYIDFAAKYGLEYIILDEGWYNLSDIMKVVPEINMEELCAYSKEKGVGIILWSTWKALEDKLDEALQQFDDWGIKGIKVDFMQRDDQWMVEYYEKILKKAAEHKLLVDFHGSYKPTGIRRAYPNSITREGVYGNEQSKWSKKNTPNHTLMLPFIRMVVGPLDYTPGAMLNSNANNFKKVFNRPMSQGTRCHQLAMYVVFESPLQMLCDVPSNYYKEPECMKFLSQVPTVWDKTVVLNAKVGKFVTIARKNNNVWYLGSMTNWSERELEIDLSFLDKGKYKITIWKDGMNANENAQDYKMISKTVTKTSTIKIKLANGGGWAAIITKI